MKPISDIIEGKPLIHASPDEPVREVARRMAARNIGAVAVVKEGALVGIFTERDLMIRVVAGDLDPSSTTVETVMTREMETASPSENTSDCLEKMKKSNIRHLPVVDQGTLVGMLSFRDLIQWDHQQVKARALLLADLVTTKPEYES